MRKVLLVLVFFVSNIEVFAQTPPPPTPPPPPGLPIDGGLLVMLIVSVSFGLYKIYQYKKRALK